jgi:hypothetical protein
MNFKKFKKNMQNIKIKAILKPIKQLFYSFFVGIYVALECFFGNLDNLVGMIFFVVNVALYIIFIGYTIYDSYKYEILFQHFKKRTQEYCVVVEIAKAIKNADSKDKKKHSEELIEALTINSLETKKVHKNDKKTKENENDLGI